MYRGLEFYDALHRRIGEVVNERVENEYKEKASEACRKIANEVIAKHLVAAVKGIKTTIQNDMPGMVVNVQINLGDE